MYESTTACAQKLAKDQILRPSCLDVGPNFATTSNENTKMNELSFERKPISNEPTISFWSNQVLNSHEMGPPDFPVTMQSKKRQPLFARSSSFTNDITDGRLRHSEVVDNYEQT